MSMILDALQRADRERRKDETPAPTLPPAAQLATPAPEPARRGHRQLGLTLLITVVAIVGAVSLMTPWRATGPEPSQPTAALPEEDRPPEPSLPSQDGPAIESRQPGIERLYQASTRSPQPDQSIATLYRQAQAPEETASAENIAQSTPPSPEPGGGQLKDTPVETPEAPSENLAEPASAPPPAVTAIRDLSWSLQQEIPSLNYQAHQYRDEPGQASTVTINQREYRVGDPITPDLRVERIDEDGVVLSFKGQSFKLQALNSWINM